MRFVLLALLMSVVAIVGVACGTDEGPRDEPRGLGAAEARSTPQHPGSTVLLGGRSVRVEIADDWESRGRGLGGRTRLGPDEGMLFLYPRAEGRSFWMKGCLIGLDILFLDDEGRILNIASLDPPVSEDVEENIPSARSIAPASMVLELRKGWCEDHSVKPGERVRLSEAIRLRRERLRERDS